jgi:hypothetical protein
MRGDAGRAMQMRRRCDTLWRAHYARLTKCSGLGASLYALDCCWSGGAEKEVLLAVREGCAEADCEACCEWCEE